MSSQARSLLLHLHCWLCPRGSMQKLSNCIISAITSFLPKIPVLVPCGMQIAEGKEKQTHVTESWEEQQSCWGSNFHSEVTSDLQKVVSTLHNFLCIFHSSSANGSGSATATRVQYCFLFSQYLGPPLSVAPLVSFLIRTHPCHTLHLSQFLIWNDLLVWFICLVFYDSGSCKKQWGIIL